MDKKICPMKIGKLTIWPHIKSFFKRDYAISSYCINKKCAWWHKDANECAMLEIEDIANAVWDRV